MCSYEGFRSLELVINISHIYLTAYNHSSDVDVDEQVSTMWSELEQLGSSLPHLSLGNCLLTSVRQSSNLTSPLLSLFRAQHSSISAVNVYEAVTCCDTESSHFSFGWSGT
jgi:hypothetical protein